MAFAIITAVAIPNRLHLGELSASVDPQCSPSDAGLQPMHRLTLSLTVCSWAGLSALIAWLFHVKDPQPYMDEPFHVPQTQRYCAAEFGIWDPKITTFPGLYIAGTAWAHLLWTVAGTLDALGIKQPFSMDLLCGTTALRLLNTLMGASSTPLFYATHRQLHPDCAAGRSLGVAVMLALFPLHYFFQFLYYTDVGSLIAVIAMHLACLQRQYGVAALAAAAATGMRQTNAVWAAFSLFVAVMQECGLDGMQPGLNVLQHAAALLQRAVELRGHLLKRLWALAAVPAAFVAFVIANGGIVVGDKAAHAPARHLVQPLYFAAFSATALAPAVLSPSAVKDFIQRLRQHPLAAAAAAPMAVAVVVAVIDRGTVVHPYLLADNRHYTFYLWKDVLGRSAALRRWLAPVYVVAAAAVWRQLRATQPALWCAAWGACTAVVLVPAALIELRYFTVPFVLLALHMRPPRPWQISLMGAAYAAVNAATVYMFLFQPFACPDGSIVRFMW